MTSTTRATALDIRRGERRGVTQLPWLHSRHSFSFGRYHDPQRVGYRTLRVINDDIVQPGQGFGEHGHDNMEILTWVLRGALRHGDSLGSDFILRPGELQAMTAGRGIRHSEWNASDTEPVHFLQIWLEPATRDAEPRYGQKAFPADGRAGRWQTLATGRGDDPAAMPLNQDVDLRVIDLQPGQTVQAHVETGRAAYLHLATGSVTMNHHPLSAGDAALSDEPGTIEITAAAPTQVLWFDLP